MAAIGIRHRAISTYLVAHRMSCAVALVVFGYPVGLFCAM